MIGRTRMAHFGLVTFAVTAIALGAACGDDVGDEDTGSAPPAARDGFSEQDSGGKSSATSVSGGGGTDTVSASIATRKIIFTAAITLDVSDVSAAFNEVGALARANGGFVEKSSFSGNADAAQRSGSLTLRVPADRYEETLGEVRRLAGASVRTESSKSNEVTDQYADLQSRLRNLERTEEQYLALMQQAKNVQEILALTDRLDSVRGEIEQTQGRIKVLDDLTDFATIDVTLAPVVAVRDAEAGGPKGVRESFVDAWDGSLEVGRYLASAGAVGLVIAAWLAIPAGLVVLAVRFANRRTAHGNAVTAVGDD